MDKKLEQDVKMPIIKDYGEYLETEHLMMAKNPNENGAYIAHFKTASIPSRPADEYEREALLRENQDELAKIILLIQEKVQPAPQFKL